MANEPQIVAGQPAPIGELRKDFDRLRTVLFKRLRTQSSNFNYKGKRKSHRRSGVDRGKLRIYSRKWRRAAEYNKNSVKESEVASTQATSARP